MIYGRVIGNELRDVPPERLPIWGQRWSGYRVPHGPSPFSTRVFSVDRMSEMGPALTSPTQFEATLTEADEGEDTSSESSQLYSSFPSPPSAVQSDAIVVTPQPEIPAPRPVHGPSSRPHGSPGILHHPSPQTSTCFSVTLLQRRQSEQLGIQHHDSEPLLRHPVLRRGSSIQGGRASFESDYTLQEIDRTSPSIQPRAGPFQGSDVLSEQIQHTLHSIPEWQFTDSHILPSAYPIQPHTSSHPSSDYLLRPLRADDRTGIIPTTPPSISHYITMPFPQQNTGIDSSWNHEPSITMIPGTVHHRNPMVSQWPSGLVPPNPSSVGHIQNSGSSLDLEVFHNLVSDDYRDPAHPEDFLGTHSEDCTLLSLDKPGGDQFTR